MCGGVHRSGGMDHRLVRPGVQLFSPGCEGAGGMAAAALAPSFFTRNLSRASRNIMTAACQLPATGAASLAPCQAGRQAGNGRDFGDRCAFRATKDTALPRSRVMPRHRPRPSSISECVDRPQRACRRRRSSPSRWPHRRSSPVGGHGPDRVSSADLPASDRASARTNIWKH